MRLILDVNINNPNLPLIDPVMQLINDSALGIYGMLDKSDVTGRAGPLVTNATFDSQGAIVDNTGNTLIQTPVKQTAAMTIIYVWQLSRPATDIASVAIGNLAPGAAPFTGFRMTTGANGSEFVQTGTGLTSPSVNQLQTTHTNTTSWVAQAVAWDASRVDKYLYNSSTVVGGAWQSTPANAGDIFYLNGMPASSPATVKAGYTGKMGIVGFYNRKMTAEEITALLNTAVKIINGRGVSV